MSGRRNVKPEPNLLARRPYRDDWPPACPLGCGFTGEPNDQQTPYAACVIGGVKDSARHQRPPLGGAS